MIHSPVINRYILTVPHGGAGKLESSTHPRPCGPWTTVAYYDNWGGFDSRGEGLLYSFPTKWISGDGLTMWAIFSGVGQLNVFNALQVTLTVSH